MTHTEFSTILKSYIEARKNAPPSSCDTFKIDSTFFTELKKLLQSPHNFSSFTRSEFLKSADTLSSTIVDKRLFGVKKQVLMSLAQVRDKYAKAAHRNFEVIRGGKVA